jgi:hypothetical protein
MSNTFIGLDKSYGSLCQVYGGWRNIVPYFSAYTSLIIISPHYFTHAYQIGLSDAAGPRDSISNIYLTNKIYYHCVTCVGLYQCDKYCIFLNLIRTQFLAIS